MARSFASASACASSFNSANCAVVGWWLIGGVLGGAAMHPIESEYSMDKRDWLALALIASIFLAVVVAFTPTNKWDEAAQRLGATTQRSMQRIADAWQRVAE